MNTQNRTFAPTHIMTLAPKSGRGASSAPVFVEGDIAYLELGWAEGNPAHLTRKDGVWTFAGEPLSGGVEATLSLIHPRLPVPRGAKKAIASRDTKTLATLFFPNQPAPKGFRAMVNAALKQARRIAQERGFQGKALDRAAEDLTLQALATV